MSGQIEVDGGVLEFTGFDAAVTNPGSADKIKLWLDTNDDIFKFRNSAGVDISLGNVGAPAELYQYFEASSPVAMFDIDPIPDDAQYNNIILEAWLRGDTGSTITALIRPNNDSTAGNYASGFHSSYQTASAWAAGAIASLFPGSNWADGTGSTAGSFTYIQSVISRYNKAIFKRTRTFANGNFGASGEWVAFATALWKNTADVDRITITPASGNWLAGSGYRLWLQ